MSAAVTASAEPMPISGVSRNGERAHSSSSKNVPGKMRSTLLPRCWMSKATAESRYSRTGIPIAAETIRRIDTHS